METISMDVINVVGVYQPTDDLTLTVEDSSDLVGTYEPTTDWVVQILV